MYPHQPQGDYHIEVPNIRSRLIACEMIQLYVVATHILSVSPPMSLSFSFFLSFFFAMFPSRSLGPGYHEFPEGSKSQRMDILSDLCRPRSCFPNRIQVLYAINIWLTSYPCSCVCVSVFESVFVFECNHNECNAFQSNSFLCSIRKIFARVFSLLFFSQ